MLLGLEKHTWTPELLRVNKTNFVLKQKIFKDPVLFKFAKIYIFSLNMKNLLMQL